MASTPLHKSKSVGMLRSASESLFTYDLENSFESYSNSSYIPMFWNETALRETVANFSLYETYCGNDSQCLFDAVMTDDLELGLETNAANREQATQAATLANLPPAFPNETSFGILQIIKATAGSIEVMATDPNQETVSFSSTSSFDGLSLSGTTLSWAAQDPLPATGTASVTASDQKGAAAVFTLRIRTCSCIVCAVSVRKI